MDLLSEKLIKTCLTSASVLADPNSSIDEKSQHRDHLVKMLSLPNVEELFSADQLEGLKAAISSGN
jgi:hypothetical protein